MLSRNVPVSNNFMFELASNSVTISVMKTVFKDRMMPLFSAFLSRVKIGAVPRSGLGVLQDQRTRALIDLHFGLISILSPILLVFVFDESCYRG